ncbi:hypothetical protein [Streptantibioticus ferralitis]|uniref:Uncharacterized protein n=1 Tax=Streptantibioticus ferralitis TaxID=236510 RepID=A0ABT5Z3S3_9ACTN|nr:hypothetical protein [Streptantibioticus ferralitis]MDF2258418.1 hypothetical protein [Streptantibioticus ferralitis]
MGITTAWAISAHNDAFIEGLAPRIQPLIEAECSDPVACERWRRWQAEPLPDYRTWRDVESGSPIAEAIGSFLKLTASGQYIQEMYDGGGCDEFWLIEDVWGVSEDAERMFLSVQSKTHALSAFFHAIGPNRAALLPGWCGNFLLTSAEVRDSLPQVERALTFTDEERAAAASRIWLDDGPDEESVLDGPLRQWRQAAAAGLGLCGVSLTIY